MKGIYILLLGILIFFIIGGVGWYLELKKTNFDI